MAPAFLYIFFLPFSTGSYCGGLSVIVPRFVGKSTQPTANSGVSGTWPLRVWPIEVGGLPSRRRSRTREWGRQLGRIEVDLVASTSVAL